MNAQGGRRTGMGASSLLLILVVLCLTTLGVLALTSAAADRRLGERAAESAALYYEASARAQEKIAQIDAELAKAKRKAADSAEYEALKTEIGLEFVETDQGTFFFLEELGDGRALEVRLQALPYGSEARYRVAKYALIETREWSGADTDWAIE